jgi:hypothetical protein
MRLERNRRRGYVKLTIQEHSCLNGKVDKRIDLVAPVAVVGEPLEMDDKNLGEGPEVEFLGGLLVLLAGRAVPRIVRSQLFLYNSAVGLSECVFHYICFVMLRLLTGGRGSVA